MPALHRRSLLAGLSASLAASGSASAQFFRNDPWSRGEPAPDPWPRNDPWSRSDPWSRGEPVPREPMPREEYWGRNDPASLYAAINDEPFPVPAFQASRIDRAFWRTRVGVETTEAPGTIVIDPGQRFLYLVEQGGRAMRYGVGVGRQGFSWSGSATIESKQEWPDWYPPKEMVARQPEIAAQLQKLQGGLGVPGGPRNPLGARALYLYQNGKDTLYRIHGTLEPWTIGTSVSSGCVRMINQDVIDLYERVALGTKVVVLESRGRRIPPMSEAPFRRGG